MFRSQWDICFVPLRNFYGHEAPLMRLTRIGWLQKARLGCFLLLAVITRFRHLFDFSLYLNFAIPVKSALCEYRPPIFLFRTRLGWLHSFPTFCPA
jgi:hypothetical protein